MNATRLQMGVFFPSYKHIFYPKVCQSNITRFKGLEEMKNMCVQNVEY